MSRILAAVDGTPTARPVLEVARLLARTFDAQVEALHVVAPGEEPPAYLVAIAGMPLRILIGDPVDLICAAVAPDVVLAVVGARRGAADRRPVGHVAFDLLTRLEIPVVVVPPEAWDHVPPTVGKVLVPLDPMTAASPVLQATVSAFAHAGAEVVVVHVVDEPPRFLDRPERDLDEWAHQLVGRHLPVAVRTEIRTGATGAGALTVADTEGVDLIVLGWSRRFGGGHAAVVRDILSRARVPVVLLPVEVLPRPFAAAGVTFGPGPARMPGGTPMDAGFGD